MDESDVGPAQQLEPLASNLDVVRRSVEQLAAKQEQMAQNMATLQAVEEDIRQKMSSSPSQPAASIPQQKPRNLGRSHLLCSRRRRLARRLLADHSCSRADGDLQQPPIADFGIGPLLHVRLPRPFAMSIRQFV